jgi:hypothetical protein
MKNAPMAQKFCDRGRKTTFATLSLLQCQTLVGSPSARHKAADLGPAGGRARTSPQGDSGTGVHHQGDHT